MSPHLAHFDEELSPDFIDRTVKSIIYCRLVYILQSTYIAIFSKYEIKN